MKKHIHSLKSFIAGHKILSILVLLAAIFIGYWGYGKFAGTKSAVRYITAKVEKGPIVVSVSGSGQVSALNQIDVKAKASGDVAYIAAADGQKIGAGGIIAKLDDRDAQKSVRDAEINLESARISLNKLKTEKSAENMNADLTKSYDDGFNTVSNVFLDSPGIMTGLNNIFFKRESATDVRNVDWYEVQVANSDREQAAVFKKKFIDSYDLAVKAHDANFENYKSISRATDNMAVEKLIESTYDTQKIISDAIKNANNYIDFVDSSIQDNNFDTPAIIATHKAALNGYTSDTNSHLINLLSIKTSIKSYKDAFLNSDLDIQSSALSVRQKENALQDAKEKLEDYFIRAPFSGTITKINAKKTDSISSGTVVATLITSQQIAEISMNEVDVAKIKTGQKTTLTFDAIPDLVISGTVADIDAIGAVAQGVVTYIVKISFGSQDARVKPGMSVTASITAETKENVLVVPNSAIKSQSGKNYVEQNINSPVRIPVQTGISNDTETEIISGLTEGEEIIVRTVTTTGAAAATAPSLFGSAPGTRAASGGNARFQSR